MKRDANDTSSNPQTQPDPMAINETNSGQIVNGNFTDTSNGAEIPTALQNLLWMPQAQYQDGK